ncbi:50S ribosomal protein L3 [Acidiplasma cupricumulans]|uniref:50S ribosomal protein L3 n=1 Tax=Acidiplasma cupricumulans TaxID=312540 RepID=UPI00078398CD|nr:50S ribosomal protein L3 [Acidiplasma cupricumulans]
MATPHHSRRGSMAYYPRVRAKNGADIRSWPEIEGKAKIQAFAGYKVGMTHIQMTDYRKNSVTAGKTIMAPVTVVEVPPLNVIAIRYYEEGDNGLQVFAEERAENIDKSVFRRIPEIKNKKELKVEIKDVADVRLIVHTNPKMVPSIPSKTPEIFEIRIGGSTIEDRIKLAKEKLGKELIFSDFASAGSFIDVISVTKGKGFQGVVKRFGVKLLPRKNRKHRRMIGTLGPWHPDWVRNTVPQAGQVGFHQRTLHNIRVVKVDTKDHVDDINVKGGFLNYGLVKNDYVLLYGSISGPAKRLIKLRDPARQTRPNVENIDITYISKESKQGD